MKYTCTCFLLLMLWSHGKAQDIHFSQFHELPLLRNPALAGIFRGDFRITSAYRSQWQSVTVPYRTQALGVECRKAVSNADHLVIGLQISNDIAGDSKMGKTQVLPLLAFNKSLGAEKNSYLTVGFMGGGVQQRFDPSQLKMDDQFVNGAYSPSNPTRESFKNTSKIYADLNAGLSFSSSARNAEFYIGAAYFHLTKPHVAFSAENDIILNPKMVLNAGLNMILQNQDKLIFYGDYFTQGGNKLSQFGLFYRHNLSQPRDDNEFLSLTMGTAFRWKDAFIPVIRLDYYHLGVGLSYDINNSKLAMASKSQGAFELTLSYRNLWHPFNGANGNTKCPAMF